MDTPDVSSLLLLFQAGDYAAAGRLAEDLIARESGGAVAWKVLAASLRLQGKSDLDTLFKASKACPDDAEVWCNLGHALREQGASEQAMHCFRRSVLLDPDFAIGHCNLGIALLESGKLIDAVESLQKALRLRPGIANGHNNLGIALGDLGRFDEALAQFRLALAADPTFFMAFSNTLFMSNLVPGIERGELMREAMRYGETVARVAKTYDSWPNTRDAEKPLRIGLVSGDLRSHAVAYFLAGVLEAGVEGHWIAYDNSPKHDAYSVRIRRSCREWREVRNMSDQALAETVRRDGIDILLDLSGHTAHNRLPMFARKPAPVQATWLGYYATTGVAAMDYIFADPWTVDAEEEGYFTETVWRLPEIFSCLTVPDAAVEVSPLPASVNGHLTFGSFNNLTKVNDAVVALWSRILHAVPESRLFIKCNQNNHASVRDDLLARFAGHGIAAERLMLEGGSPRADMLAAYRRVDIALDTFPYSGCTTTAEALWMGVPVLTLAGPRFLGRQSASMLHNAGMSDWIAQSEEDYLARAIGHAADIGRLAVLRAGLRERVVHSPVFDAQRFARHFEAALRGMWRKWCTG